MIKQIVTIQTHCLVINAVWGCNNWSTVEILQLLAVLVIVIFDEALKRRMNFSRRNNVDILIMSMHEM